MGGAVAKQALSTHRELLKRLSGPSPIEYSDTFWLRLGVFPVHLSSLDPVEVDNFLEPFYQPLAINSCTTHNFHKLVLRVIGTVGMSKEPDPLLLAANSICLLRYLTRAILEKFTGHEFHDFLNGRSVQIGNEEEYPQARTSSGLLKRLVEALINVIVRGDINGNAYLVQLEAVKMLLTGCSTQLFTPVVATAPGIHPVMDELMAQEGLARSLFQSMLNNFIERPQVPPGLKVYQKTPGNQMSMFRYVRRAAATVFWLPMAAYQFLTGADQDIAFSPLADASELLLLVLVSHAPTPPGTNPFRLSMTELHDVAYLGGVESSSPRSNLRVSPCVSYGALYDAIARTLIDERSTLLLYQLLLSSQSFREYILVRSDLETMIIPMLRLMYNGKLENQSHLYLLSIILLILSQDSSFCSNSHRAMINGPEWYKEWPMRQTSLGSLIMANLLRIAQRNFAKTQDVYLHTNTLAAFTNFSGSAAGLGSHVTQRLLTLVELLTKRIIKLSKALKAEAHSGGIASIDGNTREQFLNEFLRILLEVINGIITANLLSNPELVYAILHRQDVLEDLGQLPQFMDVIENIKAVPQFFNARIDEAKSLQPGVDWNVDRVLEVIRTSLRSWRTDRLRPFVQLKFSYEEEKSPEEFFVPLIWSLVVAHSGIPWNISNVPLFANLMDVAPSTAGSDCFSVDIPLSTARNGGEPSSNTNVQEIIESS